jgi:glutamyl-tRNA synthetase
MSPTPVVTRFAPSPTGELHLGNARTALFSYLLARKHGGRFVLRIEDTDADRSQEAFSLGLQADIAWLGLQWDEGPDRGGPSGPYRQSERAALYERYLQQLEQAGLVYPCFCTPLELELSRRAQLASGRPPRYAGTCLRLSPEQRSARLSEGRKPSLRFHVAPGRVLEFDDLVYGPQRFMTDDIGDFIVRRESGSAAFFFSNAVDDAAMGITHVLRGVDHLSNTPRQRLILEALSLRIPLYGHLSLLVGADGAPLSKRHGATSVRELRETGYASAAVCNDLFRLGHSSAHHELLTLEQMAGAFELSHLQRASAHFEMGPLRHWQSEWVQSLSSAQARAWLAPMLPPDLASEQIEAFVAAVLPNVVLADDARLWKDVVFGEALTYEEPALAAARDAGTSFFETAAAAVADRPGAALGSALDLAAVSKATGRRGAALFTPLRAALTGRLHGPQLAPLLAAMPAGRARARLLQFARA